MLIRGTPDILKPPANPLGFSGLEAVPRDLFATNTVEDQVQFFAEEFPWYPTGAVRYYLNIYGPTEFGGAMWGYLLGHVQNLIDTESALLEGNKRSLAAAQAEPSGAAGDPARWAFAVQQGQAKLDQLLRDKAKVEDYQAQWRVAYAAEQDAARARVEAYWEDQRAQAAAREAQRQAEAAAFEAAETIRYAQAQAQLQAQVQAQADAVGAAVGQALLEIQNQERAQFGTVLTTTTVAAEAMIDAMNQATTPEEAVRLFEENLTNVEIPPPAAPPVVAVLPPNLDQMEIYQAAEVYNRLIDAGNTDGQVRDAVEYVYGAQTDADWQLLQRAADDLRRPITALPIDFEKTPVTFDDGWTPGMTMDRVTWRNRVTGQTRVGSSSDTPPSSDWEIVRTTTPLFPEDRLVFEPPTLPYNLTELNLVQKRQVYADLRKEGYTDAEIRTAVENQVGKQSDADWALVSAPSRVVPVVDTGRVDDTGRVEPPAAGGGIAPLLLAVAAAAILGG